MTEKKDPKKSGEPHSPEPSAVLAAIQSAYGDFAQAVHSAQSEAVAQNHKGCSEAYLSAQTRALEAQMTYVRAVRAHPEEAAKAYGDYAGALQSIDAEYRASFEQLGLAGRSGAQLAYKQLVSKLQEALGKAKFGELNPIETASLGHSLMQSAHLACQFAASDD